MGVTCHEALASLKKRLLATYSSIQGAIRYMVNLKKNIIFLNLVVVFEKKLSLRRKVLLRYGTQRD